MNKFQCYATQGNNGQFPMIDGCLPDRAGNGAIWIYGIEPGHSLRDRVAKTRVEPGYPVAQQLRWAFNRGIFRLLTLIDGQPQCRFREFAHEKKIFESESTHPYVKANLYPVGVRNVDTWGEYQATTTGFATKSDYYGWCKQNIFKVHQEWMNQYCPKLIYAAGHSLRDEFLQALAPDGECSEAIIKTMSNGQIKKFYVLQGGKIPIVVGPHFSGGRHGLNSYESTEAAAGVCRQLLDE